MRPTKLCLPILLAMSLAPWASAGSGAWTSIGPEGGNIRALAADPATPSTLYAGGQAGVFRSTDAGQTWRRPASTLPSVTALAATGSTVFAGTWMDGVYRSTDGGFSWAAASTGLAYTWIGALVIDPSNPARVFAGTDYGIYRSTDAGGTWALAGVEAQGIEDLAVHPAAPSTILVATRNNVYRSTDAGATWNGSGTGLTTPYVLCVAFAPSSPTTVYAGTSSYGVFKSTDSGSTWARTGPGVPSTQRILSLAVSQTDPSLVDAGTDYAGVYRSTNGGASWSAFSDGLATNQVLALLAPPGAPASVFAGTGDRLFALRAGSQAWTPAVAGLTGTTVRALALQPGSTQTILAGLSPDSLQRSTDGGRSWARTTTGLLYDGIRALAFVPGDPTTAYAGSWCGGALKTTDSGASWVAVNAGLWDTCLNAVAIDPATPATVYVASQDGIAKSTDAGQRWFSASSGLGDRNVRSLVVDPSTPTTLYAATYAWAGPPLYKSTDGGMSWNASANGLPTADHRGLAVDPAHPDRLYVGTTQGVYKSTDAGASWQQAHQGLTAPDVLMVVVDPSQTATVYAATYSGGVFVSTDSGGRWAPVARGFGPRAEALALAPDGRLIAGFQGAGLWELGPAGRKGDLDGDGQPDLLFGRPGDGAYKVWLMNGSQRASEAPLAPETADPGWVLRGADDFDADGRSDLVFWSPAAGEVQFWLMNGTARVGAPQGLSGGPALPASWTVAATADFDHDGRPDIVWRNADSQKLAIWTLVGTARTGQLVPSPDQAVHANWRIVAAADYDDDGNTDLLWYNDTTGKIVIWFMDAAVARRSGQFTTPANAGDSNWKVLASADYSGAAGPGTPPAGSPDVVWRNADSGRQVVWHLDFAATRVHGEFTTPAANEPALDWTIVGPR